MIFDRVSTGNAPWETGNPMDFPLIGIGTPSVRGQGSSAGTDSNQQKGNCWSCGNTSRMPLKTDGTRWTKCTGTGISPTACPGLQQLGFKELGQGGTRYISFTSKEHYLYALIHTHTHTHSAPRAPAAFWGVSPCPPVPVVTESAIIDVLKKRS